MCVIVDANMGHKFSDPPDDDVAPLVKILTHPTKMACLCIGGKLRVELLESGNGIRRLMKTLDQAGRLHRVDDAKVTVEETRVRELLEKFKISGCDDPHIIALARVSGTRLLVSQDSSSKLHQIFKDRRFIDPPGSVYQNKSHAHLLVRARDCGKR